METPIITPEERAAGIHRSGQLVGLAIGLCALSTIMVGLRCWVRIVMIKKGLGWDDGFIIAGGVVNIVDTAVTILATKYGLGHHMKTVSRADLTTMLKFIFTTSPVYLTLVFLCKTSVVLFYRRLTPSRRFHHWCWAYIVLNTMIWIVFLLLGIMMCSPVSFFWNKTIPHGKCMKVTPIYLTMAALAVFMDVVALLLPVPAVLKLKVGKKKKLGLVSLFAFGFVVCIASFFRMHSLFNWNPKSNLDFTWDLQKSYIWTVIEVNLGIITICAPISKLFLTGYLWPKVMGRPVHGSTSASRYNPQSGLSANSVKKSWTNVDNNCQAGEETEIDNFESLHSHKSRQASFGETNSASTSTRELQIDKDNQLPDEMPAAHTKGNLGARV